MTSTLVLAERWRRVHREARMVGWQRWGRELAARVRSELGTGFLLVLEP